MLLDWHAENRAVASAKQGLNNERICLGAEADPATIEAPLTRFQPAACYTFVSLAGSITNPTPQGA